MIVGKRLREARINKGLTQSQLGEILGVTKGAVSLYESEQRSPKSENILEMIYALGVSADYLLGSDVIVEVIDEEAPKYRTVTKNEMKVIEELRKDELAYDIIFQNPKTGIEVIKQRIG